MPSPFKRAGGTMRDVARGRTPIHRHLRERLVVIVLATVVVDAVGTMLVLMFERHASGTKITNIGDSVFWCTAQLLTVSSQLPNPLTTGGRIVDVFLEAWAISVVAALAGSLASFFNHMSLHRLKTEALHEEHDLLNRPLPGSRG
jgi:hypothetical protein